MKDILSDARLARLHQGLSKSAKPMLGRPLSEQEITLCKLIADCQSNAEIAASMGLTEGTTKVYIHRIFQKLGFRSRTQIVKWLAPTLGALLLLAVPALAAAQPAVTLSTASAAFPGATLTLSMNLSGSAGLNLAGIGFGAPTGTVSAAIGAASTAAGKTLWTSATTNMDVGFTNVPPPGQGVPSTGIYSDGVIATVSFVVPSTAVLGSTLSIALPMLQSVNSSGTPVAITTAPLLVTVGTSPACAAAISANIAAYLAVPQPSATLLGQVVLELAAARTTGTCQ